MPNNLTLGLLLLLLVACESKRDPAVEANNAAASSSVAATVPPVHPTAAPAPDANAADPALRAACNATCAASEPLHCEKQPSCLEICTQTMHMPGCDAELLRFLACAARAPTKQWACDEGTPTLKDGVCDAEQAKVAACVGSK